MAHIGPLPNLRPSVSCLASWLSLVSCCPFAWQHGSRQAGLLLYPYSNKSHAISLHHWRHMLLQDCCMTKRPSILYIPLNWSLQNVWWLKQGLRVRTVLHRRHVSGTSWYAKHHNENKPVGPHDKIEWTPRTIGALIITCACALLANGAGIGGRFLNPLYYSSSAALATSSSSRKPFTY